MDHITLTAERKLPIQAYRLSETDIRRYVISGVDPGENP